MITALPVSGDPEMRAVLRALLRSAGEINPVEEAWDGSTARERVRTLMPDVVVVHTDARTDGLAIIQEIGYEPSEPSPPRILLVGSPSHRLAEKAIAVGASGLLAVDSLQKDLVRAVRSVIAGHAFFSAEITRDVIELAYRRIWTQEGPETASPVDALTDRQHEVLRLLSEGLSNHEIARRLCLRPGTVKTHVSGILNRLGAQNRVEAARFVFQRG